MKAGVLSSLFVVLAAAEDTPAIFVPAVHDKFMLAKFVAHHGEEAVARYFDTKKRTGPMHLRFEKSEESGLGHEKDLTWGHSHKRFDALGPVLPCPPAIFTTFGHGDEEKRFCGLPSSKEKQLTIGMPPASPCVVISVGGKNRWDFEEAILARMPHCFIHTLDCTIKLRVPPALLGKVSPHQICLGAETEVKPNGWQFMTWGAFVAHIKLEAPPTALKMDIEGFEWEILPAIAVEKPSTIPLSISFELHYLTQMRDLGWYGRFRSPYEIASLVDFLFTRGGYSIVDRHDNPYCKHCTELVMARV